VTARLSAALAVVVALSGCASGGLSGIGGSSSYSCAAPAGVSCMSVTGISVNAEKNNLPALRVADAAAARGGMAAAQPEVAAVSQTAAATVAALPPTVAQPAAAAATARMPEPAAVSPRQMEAPFSGAPIRTPMRVLRIWMAPYEDAERDLHDQKYLYVTIDGGRWLIEANQAQIQNRYRQVFPLSRRDELRSEEGDAAGGGAPGGSAPSRPSAAPANNSPFTLPGQQPTPSARQP
jgi:conjugal transfer pilus assembly protein TraV